MDDAAIISGKSDILSQKKNIVSETKNKIIPNRCNSCTLDVWRPWKVDSINTSLNHIPITSAKYNKRKNKPIFMVSKSWKIHSM